MVLIPLNAANLPDIGQAAELEDPRPQPSKTWRIDWHFNKVEGMADEKEAVEQAIYMILYTQRFAFVTVSWNYGFEMNALLGKSADVLRSECRRLVTEALTADDRIKAVENFQINWVKGNTAEIEFTAVTLYGNVEIKGKVSV